MRSNQKSKQQKKGFCYSMLTVDDWAIRTQPNTCSLLFAKCHAGWSILVRPVNGMTNDGHFVGRHTPSRLWRKNLRSVVRTYRAEPGSNERRTPFCDFLPNFDTVVCGEPGATIFIKGEGRMAWLDTNVLTPNDGEKILFHCKNWYRKSMWEIGRYCKDENRVYNHYVGRVYEFYDWKDVDYWFKVPAIQNGKKTRIAEEFVG